MIPLIIIFGKALIFVSRVFNIGSGGTWPGEIALFLNPGIIIYFLNQVKKNIVIVAGTNGKTTTSKMIQEIISRSDGSSGDKVIIHNESGANLLNGIVSAFIQNANMSGRINADFAVLEVDENVLPILISKLGRCKSVIVLLNLFRDQLDRYGEVDTIARKWQNAMKNLNKNSEVVLNTDDPQIAALGKNRNANTTYFGIERPEKFIKTIEHATDSTYCINCGEKLSYKGIYFSHLGIWYCKKCKNKRPHPDITNKPTNLLGIYNEYNSLAAYSVAKILNLNLNMTLKILTDFKPAFGRQEEFIFEGKKIKILLSKNPTGFNASLRAVLDSNPKQIMLVLNDRIPDGRDISWIWDVDFEMISETTSVIVSGDRAYDMGLRMKYTSTEYQISKIKYQKYKSNIKNKKLFIETSLTKAIDYGINTTEKDDTLYILPTYSAMLEVRKILTGRKIL